ncbi:MAG: hypothetical protein HC869_26795 [Rhodospirillales bacterium]|nr:hypothetical protein [Rhodospirillales bacterium]
MVVLGAGATKACGGPLTNEILHEAFQLSQRTERAINLELIDRFLQEQFRLPKEVAKRQVEDYPSLPLVMSLIDIAIDRKHSFGAGWNIQTMARLRHALDLAIFSVLQYRIRTENKDLQKLLFVKLNRRARDWGIVSLNYDIFPDNALVQMSSRSSGQTRFADYGCDIFVPGQHGDAQRDPSTIRHRPSFGKLLKLHGSLNWYYCPHCQRLDLGISAEGNLTEKVLHKFVKGEREKKRLLETRYEGREVSGCEACGAEVRPVLISPSLYKDYRNPHISRIWYEAEMLLRHSSQVVFIGYSFPDDDVHVAYLMKRALQHLAPERITVVEYSKKRIARAKNVVYQRYRAMFGKGFNWFDKGLEQWLLKHSDQAFRAKRSV